MASVYINDKEFKVLENLEKVINRDEPVKIPDQLYIGIVPEDLKEFRELINTLADKRRKMARRIRR